MSQDQVNGVTLHRLVKLLMDTGEAATVHDAEKKLKGYRLGIHINADVLDSPAYQAGLLTAINTGRRCFLGGVLVSGNLDVPLRIPWRGFNKLAEAVRDLQGEVVQNLETFIPLISFSDKPPKNWAGEFGVKPIIRGWSGGVLPIQDRSNFLANEKFTSAGVLAGALAISEAFQFIRGDSSTAGKRPVGLSLWNPSLISDWLDAAPGPDLAFLPKKLWLIGLGNLGQAYLWTLGFLPYKADNKMKDEVKLVLQDTDKLEDANDSTSLLTDRKLVGIKKTRAMADWCEQYGFQTALIERTFAADFAVNDDEPHLVLCGVDNAEARAALQKVGFKRIIEAGLGKGVEEYLCFQVHTFPASKSAESYWSRKIAAEETVEKLIQKPAYQDLYGKGFDQCGLTELAGRSVGAPFVGAIASAFVIAEALRLVNNGDAIEVIDGDLRSSKILNNAIPNRTKFEAFNPGMIEV
jgi:hypothetical protein